MGISLNPETFVEGGLVDDINCVWEKARFTMYDYEGKANPAPGLMIDLKTEDGDEYKQFYSAGAAKDWAPSDDGKELVPVGGATALRSSSNVALLIKSLIDCGFPEDQIGEDISVFDGIQCHMGRVPAPKRAGLAPRLDNDGKEIQATVLIVDEILALPGEKKKPAGKSKSGASAGTKKKAPAKTKAAPKDDGDDEVKEKASEFILGLLAEEGGGPIPKKDIPKKAMVAFKDDPQRAVLVKTVFDDSFLSDSDGWTYEDGNLSLA